MSALPGLFRTALVAAALAVVLGLCMGAEAARQPLLVEGKRTLFQRVLTRPDALLAPEPGEPNGRPVPPLSIFYVYDRLHGADGVEWLEVGTNTAGRVSGWVEASATIEWRQALALSFANPAGRKPVLFFRDEASMLDLVESEELPQRLADIRTEIAASGLSARPEVIAREPDSYVDIRKQFYLLPILSAREALLASGFRAKSVQVAAVTAAPAPEQESAPVQSEAALSDFSAAVVFVIDASTSMGPYINEAREAVARIYARIESSGLSGKVRFGLVGYRDDPKAVHGVEYLTRIFVDPAQVSDGDSFLAHAAALEPSKVSTRSFEEDGLAGVIAALDEIDWSPYGGRYIVFITDASSRGGAHPFSSTGLGPEQVRERAHQDYVALYSLHLRTPAGRADHAGAERQYRALSEYPGIGSLYFPVEAGDVELFRGAVDALAQSVVDQVAAAARGRAAEPTAEEPGAKGPTEELKRKSAELGHAMRLIWLGRTQKSGAPPLIRAWALDRDLDNPAVQALEVRVLLTKNQLSDLQAALREIVSVGIATETSRGQFFDRLRSAVAALSRDPNQVDKSGAASLKELGLIGEYLEDLPYRSRVLALDEATWNRWSIGEQVAFIDDLSARIRLYQRFHDDVDNWIALDGGASPGDAVYAVPLSALP
ncbi:MAG TPA: serine/threonine protein kinase, partial [Alphaproteobacteria bacterium]